jgi:hypothetical protein
MALPKLNVSFSLDSPASVLEAVSPKEKVTEGFFGGEDTLLMSAVSSVTGDSADLESSTDFSVGFGVEADSAASRPEDFWATSASSWLFLPTSSSFFTSSSKMTSLSSKVESKSATLFPLLLLSAS